MEKNIEKLAELCPIAMQNKKSCLKNSNLCGANKYQECFLYQSRINQILSEISIRTQYGSEMKEFIN